MRALAVFFVIAGSSLGSLDPEDAVARKIASHLKMRRGIALDLGCGDARLAVAVARQTDLLIHCIDPDEATVDRARREIDAAGLYGTRVTADREALDPLRFPDFCASLIICGDGFTPGLRGRNFKELYRVLSPNGIAFVGGRTSPKRGELEGWLKGAGITTYEIFEEDGVWAKITRPRSPGWDEWTHRSHDPGNSFGSRDTVSGTAYKPLWFSDYRPGLSSAAVALGGGRMVLASMEYPQAPERTPYIQVLDAYTGLELWSKFGKKELPIERLPGVYSNKESCSDIALVDDTLYLLAGKFCHAFDAANGKLIASFPIPSEAKPEPDDVWLYLSIVDDTLYGAVGKPPGVRVEWCTMMYRGISKAVFAQDRLSGKLRWISPETVRTASLVVGGDRLYSCGSELKLRALDRKTGKEVWTAPLAYPAGTEIAWCSYYQDKLWLLYNEPMRDSKGALLTPQRLLTMGMNDRNLSAFSPEQGRLLFECQFDGPIAGVTFAGDVVYGSSQHHDKGGTVAVDVNTGKQIAKLPLGTRCTPILASPNLVLGYNSQTCMIYEVATKTRAGASKGFRPTCSYPGVPANGMIYMQSEGCACVSPIRGNVALIPGKVAEGKVESRLAKGKAFGQDVRGQEGWATWRADAARSGRTLESARVPLTPAWSQKLPGRSTPLAVGAGLVYLSAGDRKLSALDSANGHKRWQYVTDGWVTESPFLSQGRVYAGDDAGWVFCLRADTGELVWKFNAALGVERMVSNGRLGSRWPCGTGVIVSADTVYCTAGYFPNEGTAVYAIDAVTGSVRQSASTRYVPRGTMALGKERLFIPTGVGAPWQVDLNNFPRPAELRTRAKGRDLMVVDGESLVTSAPGLEYVHHVQYEVDPANRWLPIVAEGTVYFLNHFTGPKGAREFSLAAAPREKYDALSAFFPVRGELQWKAWKNVRMTALIQAGGTLFTGGQDNVYAAAAADGKELWSAPVPGKVEDLAFHGGRLFVTTDSGTLVAFSAGGVPGPLLEPKKPR